MGINRRIGAARGAIGAAALLLALILVPAPLQAQSINIALNYEPSPLDLTSTRDSPSVRPTMENVVESLWGSDTEGEPVPTLATWTQSPDGKVLEFKLRKGVKFHSGDELTAKDIVFSHERSLAKAAQYARRGRLIEKVEAVDPYTVRFTFKEFDAGFFPSRQLFVVSKDYFDRVGEREFVDKPVGTGPFRFTGYAPGEWLDVEAFDGYWGDKPQVKKAHFVFVKDDVTRAAKLRAGEVDLIMSTGYNDADALEASGFRTVRVAVHPTTAIQFPFANKAAPWADVRVRLAIAEAIDADGIVKGLFHGIPQRFARYAPGEIGYDPALKPYPYDPADARRLLAAAGFANGFSVKVFYWTGTYQGVRETAEAAALYLKAVGIDAQLQALDSGQMMDLVRKSRTDEAANHIGIVSMPMANADSLETLAIAYYSKSPFSLYRNEPFDRLFEAAASETDVNKRGDILRKAVAIMHADVATIPLWSTVSVYAMKRNIDYVPVKKTFPLMYLTRISLR
jgi:peptide/nickel transport system substrate-binding protein